jgi:hypothetical protein
VGMKQSFISSLERKRSPCYVKTSWPRLPINLVFLYWDRWIPLPRSLNSCSNFQRADHSHW